MNSIFNLKSKRVVLLTTQRSGSTWLLDMLYQHPDTKVFGELFLDRPAKINPPNPNFLPPIRFYEYNQLYNQRPNFLKLWLYLNKIDRWSESKSVLAFKLMYNHLNQKQLLIPFLSIKRYKIIHLVRENTLESAISSFFLKKTGISAVFKNEDGYEDRISNSKIYIEPSSLLAEIDKRSRLISLHKKILKKWNFSHIGISYEDLQKNTDANMERIFDFLALNYYNSYKNSSYTKISQNSYFDRIKNSDNL